MVESNEEEFVRQNLGLVHSCCKRFAGRNIEYDDLFQAGSMGLLKAARDFDPERGFMFSTYAVPVILGEIKRLFRDTGAIKVSRSLKELSLKVTAVKQTMEKNTGDLPSVEEIAEKLGVESEDIVQAINVNRAVVSLTYDDGDGIRETDLPVSDDNDNIVNRLMISKAVKNLDGNDKKLIFLRYFCGMTQNDIAEKLNMTQVQVSRKEKKLLERMKNDLT